MEASRLEEGDDYEDDSSGEWVYEGLPIYPWKVIKDRNLPEALFNKLMNAPEHNPDIKYVPDGAGSNYKVDWDLWEEYYKQIKETEGFGVKIYPGLYDNAYLAPVPCFKECYGEMITELADLAIIEFNKDNPGKESKVVNVEWVDHQAARKILYYITFTAEDPRRV